MQLLASCQRDLQEKTSGWATPLINSIAATRTGKHVPNDFSKWQSALLQKGKAHLCLRKTHLPTKVAMQIGWLELLGNIVWTMVSICSGYFASGMGYALTLLCAVWPRAVSLRTVSLTFSDGLAWSRIAFPISPIIPPASQPNPCLPYRRPAWEDLIR